MATPVQLIGACAVCTEGLCYYIKTSKDLMRYGVVTVVEFHTASDEFNTVSHPNEHPKRIF